LSGTTWNIVREFEKSAGIHSLSINQWTPESQELRVRASLMGGRRETDYALSGANELSLTIQNLQPTQFEFTLVRPQVSYLSQLEELEVVWQLDDQPEQTKFLRSLNAETVLSIPVGAGAHKLTVRLATPRVNHFVLVRIHEQGVDLQESDDELTSRDRFYQVATSDEPVEFNVAGPTVLRIDERASESETEMTTKYVVVKSERQKIRLPAGIDGAAKLYRVAELAFDESLEEPSVYSPPERVSRLADAWIDTQIRQASIEEGRISLSDDWVSDYFVGTGDPLTSFANLASCLDTVVDSSEIDRTLPLGQHERATWGLGSQIAYRRAVEESELGSAPDRYVELFATRYFFDQWQDRYYRDKMLSRWRDGAGPSFGWVHDEWWDVSGAKPHERSSTSCGRCGIDDHLMPPFGLRWTAYAFLQDPGGATSPADSDVEASLGGRVQWRNRYQINDVAYHIPTMTLFGRWLTLDENPYQPGHVDQDIFTPYKRNHPVGFQAFDRFVFEPCADVKWWIAPTLSTNTDFNVFDPDYITLSTGWSQQLRDLQVDLSYRWGRYFRDEDRRNTVSQHLLYADLTFERWRNLSRRWELGFRLRQDLADGDSSAFLTITDFRSHGREYRDMHSSQLPFGSLRRQRAIDDWLGGIVEPN
jgi:hypothetical protein